MTSQNINKRVIEILSQLGSDLSEPHEIEFFLYFPTKSVADEVASELNCIGFETSVQPGGFQSEWLVLALKTMSLNEWALDELGIRLEELAMTHGGEYDGWGTGVMR
jgi:regulator of RNase E activity RraB